MSQIVAKRRRRRRWNAITKKNKKKNIHIKKPMKQNSMNESMNFNDLKNQRPKTISHLTRKELLFDFLGTWTEYPNDYYGAVILSSSSSFFRYNSSLFLYKTLPKPFT